MFSSIVITLVNSVNTIGGFGSAHVRGAYFHQQHALRLFHLKRRTQQLTLSFATEGAGLPLQAFHYYNRAVAGGPLYM